MKKIFITAPKLNHRFALLTHYTEKKDWFKVAAAALQNLSLLIEEGDTIYVSENQGICQMLTIALRKTYGDKITISYHKPNKNPAEKWNADGMFGKQYYQEKFLRDVDNIVESNKEWTPMCIRERNNKYIEDADIVIAFYPSTIWKYEGDECALDMRVALASKKPVIQVDYSLKTSKTVNVLAQGFKNVKWYETENRELVQVQ